jgi:hypothetical protein
MIFPQNPNIGQIFKPSPNAKHSYKWAGYAWEVASNGDGSADTYVSKNVETIVNERPNGAVNGSNTTYRLDNIPILGSEKVYLNGQLLRKGASDDYTMSDDYIYFNLAPAQSSEIVCSYLIVTGIEVKNEHPIGSIDGANASFILQYSPDHGTEQVYLNGLLQAKGASRDYTISGNILEFNLPPVVNSVITCDYFTSN